MKFGFLLFLILRANFKRLASPKYDWHHKNWFFNQQNEQTAIEQLLLLSAWLKALWKWGRMRLVKNCRAQSICHLAILPFWQFGAINWDVLLAKLLATDSKMCMKMFPLKLKWVVWVDVSVGGHFLCLAYEVRICNISFLLLSASIRLNTVVKMHNSVLIIHFIMKLAFLSLCTSFPFSLSSIFFAFPFFVLYFFNAYLSFNFNLWSNRSFIGYVFNNKRYIYFRYILL